MKQKLFTLFLALVASIGTMFAWDYERILIGELYYNLDATSKTAEVTSQNSTSPFWSTSITNANIPSTVTYNSVAYSVTSIGKYALYSCADLTSVTIPNSVTSIGEWAFGRSKKFTSVTIPNSVTSIGFCAFYECTGLTSVTISNSVTNIGNEAFRKCTNLTTIYFDGTLLQWCSLDYSDLMNGWAGGDLYIDGQLLTSANIPNSITSIENCSFSNCTSLTSVTIPNSVTSLDAAFDGCSNLTSVTIPNSVTSIGEWVFYECVGLTSITFPNSLASIGDYAFVNCSGLTSLEFPSSITDIGRETFSGCSGLTAMTCKAVTPPDLRRSVFYNVNKSIPLYVPAESVTAYQTTDQWEDFTNIQAISEQQSVPAVYTNQANSTQKLIHNGKVYILNDNKTYTLTGQEVK